MKKTGMVLWAAVMTAVWGLSGCGGSVGTGNLEKETVVLSKAVVNEVTEKEKPETDDEKRKAEQGSESDMVILAVSFGTSFNDNRENTIGAVEKAIAKEYPEYEVRRAFTSQMIIDILKKRDGLAIDNVTEALDRAVADGFRRLVVQPTHLMNGLEYEDMVATLEEYDEYFDTIVVGEPLLTSDEDFKAVVKAITMDTKDYDNGETAIVYMGHGTEAESNQIYGKMQETLRQAGFENYYIGTVEAEPTLEDVRKALKEKGGYKKVVLVPLMVVAGDHANNDMAGDEEDSWKTIFAADGYEVECLLQGLGELEAIQQIYVDHVRIAVNKQK
ncbi:MAG: sirohydrochlorin cobaltochelatase [Lachnospiraceae bacterium]|nr:sirohydrochlorin cobaltochelatase [Lachnospiraceae bacterium]